MTSASLATFLCTPPKLFGRSLINQQMFQSLYPVQQSLYPVPSSQRKNVVKIDFNPERHRVSIESCKTGTISNKTFTVPSFNHRSRVDKRKDINKICTIITFREVSSPQNYIRQSSRRKLSDLLVFAKFYQKLSKFNKVLRETFQFPGIVCFVISTNDGF